MTQKTDPFIGLNWGWDNGEDGWGEGMNENLIVFSFLHNKRIDAIIATPASLPVSPVDGYACFSTSDKTCYVRAEGTWWQLTPSVGMEFILKSTETVYKYNGTNLVVKTLDDFGVTPFGSSLLSAADASAARTTLVLGNVDNTSDVNKPVSTATQTALDNKVDKVVGKQLSTEDYSSAEKVKLAGIATGATANSSDATLLARSNHTGTQAISTVSGLQTALDNKLDDSQLGAANGVAPLGADSKVPAAYLPASGSYSGSWNATTNSPTITSGVGSNGQFYIVSVAGSTTIDGVSSWAIGDQIRFNGTAWQKIPNSSAVSSVAGKTGAVTLVPTDVGVNIGTNVQAWDADLDAIAALAGTSGLLRKTAANTWSLDTATYLTGNQSITLTGDASGSGTTSIPVTLPSTGVGAGTYKSVTVDVKGRVTAGTNPTTLSGYGITDATPLSHVGTGGSSHAVATTSVNGFFEATDKVKLNGIATGATANSTDSFLLNRANHTGTQTSSTISDLTEFIQDTMSTTLEAGTNVTLSYNDTTGKLTVSATGSGGSSTYLGLTDTPSSYSTHALKVVRVNAAETALEFIALGSAAFNNTGDFATSSHSHDASAIITGTLSDSRLPTTMYNKYLINSGDFASLVSSQGQIWCDITGYVGGGWARVHPAIKNSGNFVAGSGFLGINTGVENWSVGFGNTWYSPTTTDSKFSVNVNGDINFGTLASGNQTRLRGTFSESNHNFRPLFQTSSSNSSTGVGVLANGSGAGGYFNTYSGSDAQNASLGQFYTTSSETAINASSTGTGVGQPLNLKIGGVTRLSITQTGFLHYLNDTAIITSSCTAAAVESMGNYISFRDNTNIEVGWIGYGSGNGEIGLSNSSRNIRFFSPVVFNSSINGNGSGLTSLNASNLSSGTVPNARLTSATTSTAGIVQLGDGSGAPSSSKAATESWVYGINAGLGSLVSAVVYKQKPSQLTQSLTHSSAGSLNINLVNGLDIKVTVSANITGITFTNAPSTSEAWAATIEFVTTGTRTIVWPSGSSYAGGIAPTLTTNGTDVFVIRKRASDNFMVFTSGKGMTT